ncbi:MAG: calcineurin-like phosphoesterase C-terminal domain-containing protein, partial [Pseudomonadota bacterium]
DRRGRYRLPVDDETVIFITQPRGWNVPVNDVQLPQFYYINYPNGTPPVASWLFPVIDPTGPLPASVDFPLHRARRARRRGRYDEVVDWGRRGRRRNQFKALAFADPQAGSFSQFLAGGPNEFGNRQLSDLRDEFISGLIGTKADFVMVAGDVINDDLTLYPRHNRIMAAMGIPVWNVPGNHDMNFKAPDDRYSTQTYISIFGPPDYSFDYGDVHFIAMDDVAYRGNSDPFGEGSGQIESWSDGLPEGGSNVKGFFTEAQLEWLRNDLRFVPRDKLVVLYVHISLKTLAISGQGTIGAANINVENLGDLMEVLNVHPNVYSFSGHDTSNLWTLALGVEEGRAVNLPPVIHKKIAEVRTSLGGPKDDRGVRISHTQDGNPNGYYFFDFDGDRVETRYQSGYTRINTPSTTASELDDFQVRISVGVNIDREAINDLDVACPTPDDQPANGARNAVVANVFDSNAFHRVSVSLDGGAFVPMAQMIRDVDVVTLPDGLERPK